MNALVRNFAQNLDLERLILEYGATFTYLKVYYLFFNGEFVILEDFIEGIFEKYINNIGEICGDGISEISLKVEVFVYFIYVNFNQQFIVFDIQGVNYWLCDFEIISVESIWQKYVGRLVIFLVYCVIILKLKFVLFFDDLILVEGFVNYFKENRYVQNFTVFRYFQFDNYCKVYLCRRVSKRL